MERVLAALEEQTEELDGIAGGLDEAGWATPSRCAGWSVADVVLHLAQTNELVVAGAEGRFAEMMAKGLESATGITSVEDVAEVAVAAERGKPAAEVYARWRASAADQASVLGARGPGDSLPWLAGPLPARTLATTRLAELWIHTGDVAGPLGVELEPTARLWHIARLAWRTLPYAFARAGRTLAGPVAVVLAAPDGSAWEFTGDEAALTTVRGPALDFCLVAARRLDGAGSGLSAEGPDAGAVLDLVRTFA